ncbi:hypothetical protein EG68_03333 [Paragonimus skrjabini miyazakii]|uniref:Uncharacterized protein n=1 Tax=Paragonimus skrjabini miyazakii TaxID=59628 RepID=A0A8S9Z194_9TREM|nr:hypothetical protein EG68_03333 [Paragonimus skrjabini miyazakii]
MSRSSKNRRNKRGNNNLKSKSLRKKEKAMVEKSLQLLNNHAVVFRTAVESKEQTRLVNLHSESFGSQPEVAPSTQAVHISKLSENVIDEIVSAFSACK